MNINHYTMRELMERANELHATADMCAGQVSQTYERLLRNRFARSDVEFMELHVGVACAGRPDGEDMHIRLKYYEAVPSYTVEEMEEDDTLYDAYVRWSDNACRAIQYALGEWFDICEVYKAIGTEEDDTVIGWMVDISLAMLNAL